MPTNNDNMINAILRRVELIEERVNRAERDVAALTSKLTLIKDDLGRRISEIDTNLKSDAEKTRIDLRERIVDLKADMKEDMAELSIDISTMTENVNSVNKSLSKLYITQTGEGVKVKTNEKVIWAILCILGSIGLYLLQSFLKGAS